MSQEPITFYNRYKKTLQTEEIYGEKWLRFTYEKPLGQFFLGLLVKRKLFSWLFGFQMDKRVSASKVIPFILKYDINVEEFVRSAYDFKTFNEFFCRKLKTEARPITPGDDVVIFPADGRHLVFPDLDKADGFYVKGSKFSLAALFGEQDLPEEQRVLSRRFAGGSLVISRLCPVDYHRFHFPVAGLPNAPKLINGFLFSVSPIALRRNVEYLVQNKRALTMLESPAVGGVAIFEVGATNVGSIVQTYLPDSPASKGEEKGLFRFGGSCVITVFEKGRIAFDADVVEQSSRQVETYAKMGDRLGLVVKN